MAFMQVKAVCVPLLAATRTPSPAILPLLTQLATTLASIPRGVFSPALANYVFFPISSLLQRKDGAVLEGTMKVLEVLVRRWREAGMDDRVHQELWIMTILSLGGPLDPAGPNTKGKGVDKTEETKLTIVRVLLALMRPLEAEAVADVEDDPLGEHIDWTADDPTPFARDSEPAAPPPPPPVPILFHTLTTLLALASTPTSLVALQLDSLNALHILLECYLVPHSPSPGPSPLLATALPGTASVLSRIALSMPSTSAPPAQTRRQPSAVIVSALDVLSLLLASAIGDSVTTLLRQEADAQSKAGNATLEELADSYQTEQQTPLEPPPPPKASATPSSTTPGPTLPTPAWLAHTLNNLTILFGTLSTLSTHDSPTVRVALARLLAALLTSCKATLGPARTGPLEGLLTLASDTWPDVSSVARTTLAKVFAAAAADADDAPVLVAEIVKARLMGLPRALLRGEEKRVRLSARVVRAALELLPSGSARTTLGPLAGIERWSWSLLRALEFSRVVGADGERAGLGQAGITESGGMRDGGGAEDEWPGLEMAHVKDAETRRELESLWKALGAWAAAVGQEQEISGQFLGIALGAQGGDGVGASALWVLDGLLKGFTGKMEGKGRKKVVRNVVRGILGLLEQLEEEPSGDAAEETPPLATTKETLTEAAGSLDELNSVSIEHQRGVSLTPSLDGLKPVASITQADTRASQRVLLICLSLRVLSTTASLLASSFQPYLLQVPYHVLAHMSPTSHPLLRAHAQQALARIAYSTSYASPSNLVLANVDYVVNSVSQRLSISRLDPAAPLVLVEMIRLVGEPIVPMVQDLVEDVFEALDDYHGYEDVTTGLWAVLDALMKVMNVSNGEQDSTRLGKQAGHVPETEADWASFAEWFATRNDKRQEQEEEEVPPNPQTPFASDSPAEDGPAEFPEKQVTPATRPQTVVAQILAKALYFLSHSSPSLRARVLSLIASAVPLLATRSDAADPASSRQADLLPVIHRAWPYILKRLADTEPYVVLEAVGLIEALATHVGDFMSRRILDDVWPRFRTIVEKQEVLDRKSAIAGRTPYTVSHRIYRSILTTMYHVARDVPLKEGIVWEQALLFRRFLDAALDPVLQTAARQVYVALAAVNADAVWLVLTGSLEREREGQDLPAFLRMPRTDMRRNVEIVLSQSNK